MVYQYTPEALDVGRQEYREWIQRWVECEDRDEWPTYPPEITPLAVGDYRAAEAGMDMEDVA